MRSSCAREAAASFLEGRRGDRIGVILFAGIPYLLTPPVSDTAPVAARLRTIEVDRSGSGTAVGDALVATARVRRAGKTVAVVDIDVADEKGSLVAIGRGTYYPQAG